MSTTETVFAALEGASAAPVVPAASPTAQDPKPEVTPVEGQPAVAQPETPTPEAAEPEIETEPNLEEAPETSGDFAKYKPLFKEHPELRNIIGREKAFSELGQFSEVKEIVQRIPTLADAEQLVTDSEAKRNLAQTFREDTATFVESLKDSDPLAFQNLANQLPDILAESDPQLYSQQARTYSTKVLTNLLHMAQQDGNQALYDAVQMVANGLGERLGAQAAPLAKPNSELERLRREKTEREQQDRSASFDTFWNSTDQVVINNTVTDIEAIAKKAIPTATESQLKRIVQESYAKTLEMINQQPQTIAQINQYRAMAQKGKQGIAEHNAIISYVTGRVKLVVPKATKSVIDEWSKSVLQLNQDKTDKQKAIAAKTKDVGTGPQGTTSSAAAPQPANGKRNSVSTILERIEAGTYVPKR
jgi:hypothetical protein